MEFDLQRTFDQLTAALEGGRLEIVEDLVNLLHPADLVEVLHNLDDEERHTVLGLLSLEPLAEVLDEADEALQRDILETLDDRKISQIVEILPSDEAADLVGALPAGRAAPVLALLNKEDSEEVRELLLYDEETAGGIMETEVVSVTDDARVSEAIDVIRKAVSEEQRVYKVYVVDGAGRLKGALALSRLLLAKPVVQVADVMQPVVSVPTGMDQEEVAHLVRKYDITAVPVVDGTGRLVGQVTVDDVVDVIDEEATEDFSKIAGAGGEEVHEPSALRISGIRLPWLITALAGELCVARILSSFEGSFATVISIVFFLPIMTAMAGNAAIQSSAIIVRGLATGEVNLLALRRRLAKEMRISLLTGLVCGGILGTATMIWRRDPALGALLGLSLFGVIIVATTVGALIPLLLKRLGVDPAIAMGPFVTTLNDATGVVIYLGLATAFLGWIR